MTFCLSVWSLRALPVHIQYSGFLPQFKDMPVRLMGLIGYRCECVCVVVCLTVNPGFRIKPYENLISGLLPWSHVVFFNEECI